MGLIHYNPASFKRNLNINDWYLPSKDEMSAMAFALNMSTGLYWTSSEIDQNNANFQKVGFIQEGVFNKNSSYYVRPIRDFEAEEVTPVGELGGGGIIFYIFEMEGAYKHYIAAPSNAPITLAWGASGVITGATGTAIGTGKANTALIVAALEAIPETGKAAQYCNDLIVTE